MGKVAETVGFNEVEGSHGVAVGTHMKLREILWLCFVALLHTWQEDKKGKRGRTGEKKRHEIRPVKRRQ
jgi:hypothetical protein